MMISSSPCPFPAVARSLISQSAQGMQKPALSPLCNRGPQQYFHGAVIVGMNVTIAQRTLCAASNALL